MGTLKPSAWELNYNRLLGEIGALHEKIATLEMTVAMLKGHEEEGADGTIRHNVKETLLELLREAGACGLSTSLALQKAARRGVKLDRGSVSSRLSKFKKEGIAIFDGERYRLSCYEAPRRIECSGVIAA
jgi:hypothetical protein